MPWSRRAILLGCVAAPVAAWADTSTTAQNAGDRLVGRLLVATADMGDPRFAETVLLMVQHDSQGALGLTVNRPVGTRPVAELLTAIGEDPGDAKGDIGVFAGGPVQPSSVFVVHSGDYRQSSTNVLDENVCVTAPRRVLADIGAGRGPRKRILVLGYAGWGAGQLESEMLKRAWVTIPASTELVFDMDRAKVWSAALSRHTISL